MCIRDRIDTGKFVPKKEDESGMTELMSAMSELGPEEIKEVLEEIKKRKQGSASAPPTEL